MKSFAEVRAAIGGLKGVMRKLGDDPQHEHKWKSMPKCPFCLEKDCAGIFNKGGVDFFKCHKPGCSSGNTVLTEVTYIAIREGLDDAKPAGGGPSPAYKRFLQLANCWEEPAATPPKSEKKKPAPTRHNPVQPPAPTPVDPPAPPVLPNPVVPESLNLEVETAGADRPADEEELIAKCIEVVRAENKASVRSFQRHFNLGYSRATRIMDELERRGVVGPAKGTEPREILKLPDAAPGLIAIKIGDEIHIEDTTKAAAPGGAAPGAAKAKGEAPKGTPFVAEEKGPAKLALGMTSLRWLFSKLFPTESQMSPHLADGSPVPDPLPAAIAKKLKFKPVSLFEKRALTSVTCATLGLRANPTGNEPLLQEMQEKFSWEESRASGLCLEANRKAKLGRRPNAQFHGKGQIGRKPDRERKGKDDKWVWGFCEPVLIPFFDEAGDLIKLRPHKGGAPAGTVAGRPRIYVPRAYQTCADSVEKFYEVIICEGEFKAMALWQTLGSGAPLQVNAAGQPLFNNPRFEPIGVCALPGISYVTNVEMRMDLERWLVEVGARRVIVAFDDEDKSDKPLRQRFDAQRDARVLAIELSQILHVDARVCVLPRDWRNARGKADWDGALADCVRASVTLDPITETKTTTTLNET